MNKFMFRGGESIDKEFGKDIIAFVLFMY